MKAINSSINVIRTIKSNKNNKQGKSHIDVKEDVADESIAVHKFQTDPAEVSVSCALTINLGNFESAKITVSVSIPCYKEEIDDAYDFAQKWVENRIEQEKQLISNSKQGMA
jgi:hypothetical protein